MSLLNCVSASAGSLSLPTGPPRLPRLRLFFVFLPCESYEPSIGLDGNVRPPFCPITHHLHRPLLLRLYFCFYTYEPSDRGTSLDGLDGLLAAPPRLFHRSPSPSKPTLQLDISLYLSFRGKLGYQ